MRTRASLRQGRNDWYRIENKDNSDPSELYIYDEIGWFGVTAADLVNELKAVTGDLTVHINSPGGDVFDGIAILNALRNHKGDVTTVVDGLAASAASFIAQAGAKRTMARNSRMMIHDAAGLCIGNAKDMGEMTALLNDASDNIADVYAERSGRGDRAFWRERMSAETWYSPDEAVTAGLADSVDGKAEEPAENDWDLSVFTYTDRANAPAPVMITLPKIAASVPVDPEIFVSNPVNPFNLEAFKRGFRHGA